MVYTIPQMAEGIMAALWRDFWIRETGTRQQVAQLHGRYDDDDGLKYTLIIKYR